MTTILTIPGWNGSGSSHWQSLWERQMPNVIRVEQANWDHPRKTEWMATLLAAIDAHPGSILVAHSLGSVLVAQMAEDHPDVDVSAAMLVAPPDADNFARIEDPLRDFSPMPKRHIPFPTIVVASEDDPYISSTRARFFATRWGSDFVDVGRKGHINADSGLGDWPEGQAILKRLTG